jgi:hypothetical protein
LCASACEGGGCETREAERGQVENKGGVGGVGGEEEAVGEWESLPFFVTSGVEPNGK